MYGSDSVNAARKDEIMPGPPPKRHRRGRNILALGEWQVLPDTVYSGPKPPKPRGLASHAAAVWEDAWVHPAANVWDGPARLLVVEMVMLVSRSVTDPDAPGWVTAQALTMRDRLGLTARGRQQLRWLLPSEADDEVEASQPVESGDDRWGHLRSIVGGTVE